MNSSVPSAPSRFATHSFYKFWLKITAIAVGGFAPVFFLGSMEATLEPARLTLDMLSWPIDGLTTYDSPDVRFLSGITGGVLLGWGCMIWGLSIWVYDHAPEFVRRAVLLGLLTWFCLDSLGSITSGNASNVVFNSFLLLVGVGPMWRPAQSSESGIE